MEETERIQGDEDDIFGDYDDIENEEIYYIDSDDDSEDEEEEEDDNVDDPINMEFID